MRALRFLVVLALALGLSGCFQFHTVLRVFPDGSARLLSSITMSTEAYERMQALAELDPDQKGAFSLIDEEALRSAAKGYGPGVTFEGVKSIDGDGEQGYVATYRVEDVTTLALPLAPEPPSSLGAAGPDSSPSDIVTFDFQPATGDAPAQLAIQMPSLLGDDGVMSTGLGGLGTPGTTKDESGIEMLRAMLQGMQATLRIEPQGTVTATDATFEDAGAITLMRFDFDELLADPDAFNRLDAQGPPTSTDELADRVAATPGIDMEAQPTVTVSFRGE
ncbi:MAG: hypothetical protein AAFV01_12300 [Bacteroidota bacterium]